MGSWNAPPAHRFRKVHSAAGGGCWLSHRSDAAQPVRSDRGCSQGAQTARIQPTADHRRGANVGDWTRFARTAVSGRGVSHDRAAARHAAIDSPISNGATRAFISIRWRSRLPGVKEVRMTGAGTTGASVSAPGGDGQGHDDTMVVAAASFDQLFGAVAHAKPAATAQARHRRSRARGSRWRERLSHVDRSHRDRSPLLRHRKLRSSGVSRCPQLSQGAETSNCSTSCRWDRDGEMVDCVSATRC